MQRLETRNDSTHHGQSQLRAAEIDHRHLAHADGAQPLQLPFQIIVEGGPRVGGNGLEGGKGCRFWSVDVISRFRYAVRISRPFEELSIGVVPGSGNIGQPRLRRLE